MLRNAWVWFKKRLSHDCDPKFDGLSSFSIISLVCSTVYSILRHTWHTQLCQFKCKSDVSKTRNRNCYRKQASEPKNIGHRRFGESEHAFRSVGIGPWHFVSELSTQSSLWFWIGFSKNRIAIQIIINPTGYQWFINGFITYGYHHKLPGRWPSLPRLQHGRAYHRELTVDQWSWTTKHFDMRMRRDEMPPVGGIKKVRVTSGANPLKRTVQQSRNPRFRIIRIMSMK